MARLIRIDASSPWILRWVLEAVRAEDAVKRAHPGRHPGGCSTALVRFLGDYLKRVESADGRLAEVRKDLYADFALKIDEGCAAQELQCPPKDDLDEDDDDVQQHTLRPG